MADASLQERSCTLWVHDESFSKSPVIFNPAVLAGLDFQNGTLLKAVRIEPTIAVQDFQAAEDRPKTAHSAERVDDASNVQSGEPAVENTSLYRLSQADAARKHFVFKLEDPEPEYLTRHPTLQISVCTRIARLYGFSNRITVVIVKADESTHTASHVELTFRDMYLTRADMRRLTSAELWKKTLHRGQEITFLSSVRATVRAIYVNGQKVNSALFGHNTIPVFRSESARFVLYIQMSQEMREFETTCSGDIVAERVVNRFLPELFKRWSNLKAHHAISIVLFTRIEVDEPSSAVKCPETGRRPLGTASYRDYYRVVVSAMSTAEAPAIILHLKTEIRDFFRDACTIDVTYTDEKTGCDRTKSMISGRPSTARKGNILEAINLVTTQYAEDYIDRDLVRTGLSVMVISPGTGTFEVDEDMLQLTSDNLAHNGIGIDLVCLSPKPLHTTPLFCYRTSNATSFTEAEAQSKVVRPRPKLADTTEYFKHQSGSITHGLSFRADVKRADVKPGKATPHMDDLTYAVPHWLEVHYYNDPNDIRLRSNAFIPQVRMYEIQMSGRQELDMSLISIPLLSETHPQLAGVGTGRATPADKDPVAWLDAYDEARFGQPDNVSRTRKVESFRKSTLRRNSSARHRHVADIFSSSDQSGFLPHDASTLSHYTSGGRDTRHILDELPAPSLKPQPSIDSMRSTTTESSTPTATKKSASRPLFFGARGVSFTKAAPLIAQSSEAATPSKGKRSDPAAVTDYGIRGPFAISERVKSSLARLPSHSPDTSPSPARPISAAHDAKSHSTTSDGRQEHEQDTTQDTGSHQFNNTEVEMTDESTPRSRGRFESISAVNRQKSDMSSSSLPYSPWLTLVNPCRPSTTTDVAKQYRRWHHLYPRFSSTSAMKWKSLITPASLPLTTSFFPTADELREHYTEGIHRVAVDDSDFLDLTQGRAKLLNELISFRLSKGFQVVLGQVTVGPFQASEDLNIFDDDSLIDEGVTVVLSKGDNIHVLCAVGAEVQVSKYHRKLLSPIVARGFSFKHSLLTYKPFLRTTFVEKYEQHTLNFSLMPEQYNWSMVDQFLAGWDREEYSEGLNVWRARFVFIPIPPPRDPRRLAALSDDTDDEIRIEGIQRITQIWERNRHHPFGDRAHHTQRFDANPNPLKLDIQTRDASAIAADGFVASPFMVHERPDTGVSQFSHTDIDPHKLAHALQVDKSIRLEDRRWYLKTHKSCFIGSDLVTWLTHVVKDIKTREDAVRLGEDLMEKGLFKHVAGRHNFRDGNFFYSLCSEYREAKVESRTSWFSRRSDKSVPSTPALLSSPAPPLPKDIPALDHASITSIKDDRPSESELSTPESANSKRPSTVTITGMMEYDVDSRKRSKRPEVIKLHYSLLYNPESCYEFRIEWLDANPKLIEDAITHWASIAEKYGHRLVQIPIAEAHKISQTVPFRSPYVVDMSVQPPNSHIDHLFDHTTGATLANPSVNIRHGYQRALLRRYNFVLDQEAASNFPRDTKILYTWGRNDYKYNQFVHQGGHCLAQVDDQGRLLFVINRLHDYRASQLKDPGKHEKDSDNSRPSTAATAAAIRARAASASVTSPGLSALADEVTAGRRTNTAAHRPQADTATIPPEDIILSIEALCKDKIALAAFWEEITLVASAQASVRSSPLILAKDRMGINSIGIGSGEESTRSTPMLRPVKERMEREEREHDKALGGDEMPDLEL